MSISMLISDLWLNKRNLSQGYAVYHPNGYNCSVVTIGIFYEFII